MNILGLFLVEIIGAALFSLAFFGGLPKVKNLCYSSLISSICLPTYCYIEALKSFVVWVLRLV